MKESQESQERLGSKIKIRRCVCVHVRQGTTRGPTGERTRRNREGTNVYLRRRAGVGAMRDEFR